MSLLPLLSRAVVLLALSGSGAADSSAANTIQAVQQAREAIADLVQFAIANSSFPPAQVPSKSYTSRYSCAKPVCF